MKLLCRTVIALVAVLAVTLASACAMSGDVTDGDDGSAQHQSTASEPSTAASDGGSAVSLVLTSESFDAGDPIPAKHARDGVAGALNISPQLSWRGAPDGTRSFALVMVDRHPIAGEWVHWMVVDLPADVDSLPEGASGADMPEGAVELRNTFGDVGYGGPQPPPGSGVHEYEIGIYALNVEHLDLPEDADFAAFLEAVRPVMLEAATIRGTFEL